MRLAEEIAALARVINDLDVALRRAEDATKPDPKVIEIAKRIGRRCGWSRVRIFRRTGTRRLMSG